MKLTALTLATAIAAIAATGATGASAAIVRHKCSFDWYHSKDSETITHSPGDFDIEFVFDTIENKAYMIGNLGVTDVVRLAGIDGVTFVEVLEGGVTQTTTISKAGESVHSRHTIMFGAFVASQYYGTCVTEY